MVHCRHAPEGSWVNCSDELFVTEDHATLCNQVEGSEGKDLTRTMQEQLARCADFSGRSMLMRGDDGCFLADEALM